MSKARLAAKIRCSDQAVMPGESEGSVLFCVLYSGICLTSEEKHGKLLSHDRGNVPVDHDPIRRHGHF